MKKIIVLYHVHCHDGFGSAYAAWKKFGNRAEYIGVRHNEPLPMGLRGKEIYLVDFTYPEKETRRLLQIAKDVTNIDHHMSVASYTKMAHHYVFDNNHSGAVLSWKFFHPNTKIPRWLLYIEDLDLWRKKLSQTEAARAILNTYPYNFKIWDTLITRFERPRLRKKYLEHGENILAFQRRAIEAILKNAELVRFCGYKTFAANSALFADELGSALCRAHPPIGIVWSYREGKLVVSLRSDGTVDVSKLAARFGGGGHKVASAFIQPAYKPFPWKPIKK